MTQRSIPGLKLMLIHAFLLPVAAVHYDKAWCDNILNSSPAEDVPSFHRSFSLFTEEAESGSESTKPSAFSQSNVQFSEHAGQVSVWTKTLDGEISAFVDANLNVCLLQQTRDGACVKTEHPCRAISRLTRTVRVEQQEVKLKSASQSLGWDQDTFDKVVEIGPSGARGINSTLFVTCAKEEDSANTIISQWHFLDGSLNTISGVQPALIMAHHRIESNTSSLVRTQQTDYVQIGAIPKGKIRSPVHFIDSDCVSNNRKDMHTKIPVPTRSFSYVKETYMGKKGSAERDVETQFVRYNYDSDWFYYETFLNSVDHTKNTKVSITEDYQMGIRYEISQITNMCKTSPILSRAAHHAPDGGVRMETPDEFWSIDPDTAVYLGVTEIRGMPSDVWRVGLPGTDNGTTYTLFLASKEWLKRQRLPLSSFLPLQAIEDSGSNYKLISYFQFKRNFKYFAPDVSSCFNTNFTVAVRLTLLTSYYKNIEPHRLQFEFKFRRALLQLTGLASTLRVASIRVSPSPAAPYQTRVTFRILGKSGFSSNVTGSQVRDLLPATEAVARLKEAVNAKHFELVQVVQSERVIVKVKPDSFTILKEDEMLVDFPTSDEQVAPSGLSLGTVVGLSVFVALVAAAIGVAMVYGYKRWSDNELNTILESGVRPQSTASTTGVTQSDFGMLSLDTEESGQT